MPDTLIRRLADYLSVCAVPKSYLDESKAPREFDYLRLFPVERYSVLGAESPELSEALLELSFRRADYAPVVHISFVMLHAENVFNVVVYPVRQRESRNLRDLTPEAEANVAEI